MLVLRILISGNILKDGNKTGVLAGGVVSDFQERLISEKLKLARKKSSGQKTPTDQCDKVSSSSPGQAEAGGDVKDHSLSATDTQDNTEVEDTEQDDDKALKAQEEEIEKLEKKRKILEDYYKKKMEEKRKSGDNEQMLKDLKDIKNKEDKRVKASSHQSKKKRKKHSSSDSESVESDSESSDSRPRRRRHKSKHSKHKKSSKRHKSSRERSQRSSQSHKARKCNKRSRRESSSESESSEDDMEARRKLIKAQKESKSQENSDKVTAVPSAPPIKDPMHQIQSQSEHSLKTSSASPPTAPEPASVTALDAFKNAEVEIRKLLAGSKPEDDVPQIKIKPLGELVKTENNPTPAPEMDVPHDNDQEYDQEDDPDADQEQKGSFMDALQVLDKSTKKSSHKSSHSHKSRKSSPEKSHKSSSHKSSSRDKSSSHKSSSRDKSSSHKSSSRDKSSSHKSSSREKSSSHKSSSKDIHSSSHKSSRSSDHKDSDHKSSSSRHKSSSSSRHKSSKDKSKESHKGEKEKNVKDELEKSPVPDFSEELAMLPDLMDEDVDDFDNVADGLEEMFAGVEDEDELQRIFEQYEPDSLHSTEDAALRKQRQLEEKERARKEPSSSSSALAKKRLAHEGAEKNDKRPLHMRKPSLRTPAQAMADRYKKLQMMRQQQIIEKRMSEMTEDDPGESPSTSSGLGSQPGGSRSRVAHSPTSGPAVLSKAKQQLVAREKAKEVMTAAKQTTAITNVKGTQRKAHTPSSAVVRKPFVTPDPNSKVPTTVRQKYLDTIIQECLKISGGDELEAYTRAEREEANCCRKASSRMLYLNLVVSSIKKLRAEAATAAASARRRKSAPNLTEKRSMLTTHLQVG